MKYIDYVDIFHGCGEINLPDPEGIAAAWHPIKAITGNTNPAACLPFGKYSVCPYSAGYSSGYWINELNTDSHLKKRMSRLQLKGFSHFHHSGTGAIGIYYNYAVTTPYYGDKQEFYNCRDENGHPGYYAVTLAETDIRCELTVSPYAAYHRYRFDHSGGKIEIDFTNDGLYDHPILRGKAEDLRMETVDDHTLHASVTLQGVRMHFVAVFDGNGALDSQNIFCLGGPGTVELKLSVSAESDADAAAESRKAAASFDETVAAAEDVWNRTLGKIHVESNDEGELALFYSNLYHSYVKPCDWNGGGFLWKGAPFVVDFSTMWDIYKTQLPLVYTLFPETSAHIIDSLQCLGHETGRLPVSFLLSNSLDIESGQARMLMEYTFYDAWKRGVKANWEKVLDVIEQDICHNDYPLFERTGFAHRYTFTLDMAEISNGLAEMADSYGRTALAERFRRNTDKWKNTFDFKTGLMKADGEYYEGNHWNYSFRPLVRHEERIALCGGVENYVNLLDRFFGFLDPEDITARFEGFNNETDMEAPYAYHYAKRYDRLCEILDVADQYVFREKSGGTGRGGIPGNNDSGGLSSCYIWNCLGVFPVTGQNLMLLSRPKFRKVTLFLANGRDLMIEKDGSGKCPAAVSFNGRDLPDFRLPADEMMDGGSLRFTY